MQETMKTLQHSTTRQELLDNTVNHFNSTNRSVSKNGSRCVYRDEQGRGCAIGREITDDLAERFDGMGSPPVDGEDVFIDLPQRLKDMDGEFLACIQHLHDHSQCWNDEGLSGWGKGYVKSICKEYNLQIPEKAK